MSQAKTQMVNKSFGLNNNRSSIQSMPGDASDWPSDNGLNHFGTGAGNQVNLMNRNNIASDNNNVNWSNHGNSLQQKIISSNSSNSSNSDLWSNDVHNNHNNFTHIDDFLKNDKVLNYYQN